MFAANTAQWVNVTARVEKEIEIACVVPGPTGGPRYVVDPDGCDFGVVFPENSHEKVIEVTLSNSFFNQDVKSSVKYWVMWECKLVDESGAPPNLCREDIEDDSLCFDPDEGKWVHCDPLKLDGNIRDHILVTAQQGCMVTPYTGPTGGPGKIQGLGNGIVDRDVAPKCFYHLDFSPPACEGHVNYLTDPLPNPKTVECHEVTESPDPQRWDRFANLGDTFKIQVYDFGKD